MKRTPSRRARARGSMMTRVSFALLVVAFLVGCSTRYVIPPRNTSGYDYRLEVAGTKGNKQAGLKIACWRSPVIIGDSSVEYRRRLSTAGWVSTIVSGVALSGSGALGWSRGWVALGQYSIGLGVLLPVAAALFAPKHGEEKVPKSLLAFKPAVGEEVVVQNLTRSASRSYATGANGVAAVALRDIQDWFSGQDEIGIWIAPLAANERRIAAKVTRAGSVAQVSAEELSIEMAETENTAEAYKDFLREFPSSKYAPQARESMELQYWRRACLADTKEAYEEFEKECPQSESVAAVPGHIESLDWRRASQANTKESYQEFKGMHPQSESVAVIPEHIERADWGSASSANTAESYEVYLRSYPSGLFVAEARQGIERLERARQDSVRQAEEASRRAAAEAAGARLRDQGAIIGFGFTQTEVESVIGKPDDVIPGYSASSPDLPIKLVQYKHPDFLELTFEYTWGTYLLTRASTSRFHITITGTMNGYYGGRLKRENGQWYYESINGAWCNSPAP